MFKLIICSFLSLCLNSLEVNQPFDLAYHARIEPKLTNIKIKEFLEIKIPDTDLISLCVETTNLKYKHFCKHTNFLKKHGQNISSSQFNIDQFDQYYYVEMAIGAAGIIPFFGSWFLASRVMHLTDQVSDIITEQAKIIEYIKTQEHKTSKTAQMEKLINCLYEAEVFGKLCQELIAQTILSKHAHLKYNQKLPTVEYTNARVVAIIDHTSSTKIFEIEFSVIETTQVVLVSPDNSMFISKHNDNFLLTKRPTIYFSPSTNETLTLQTSDYSTRKVLVSYTSEFDTTNNLFHDYTICNSLNKIQIFKLNPTEIEVNDKPMTVHGLTNFDALSTKVSTNGKICQPVKTLKIHMQAAFAYEASLDDISEFHNHSFSKKDPMVDFIDEFSGVFARFGKGLASCATWFIHFMLSSFLWWIVGAVCAVVLFFAAKCGLEQHRFENGNFLQRYIHSQAKTWENDTMKTLKFLKTKVEHIGGVQVNIQLQIKNGAIRADRMENTLKETTQTIIDQTAQIAAMDHFLKNKFGFDSSQSSSASTTIHSSTNSSKSKTLSSILGKKIEYSLDEPENNGSVIATSSDSDKSMRLRRIMATEEENSKTSAGLLPPPYSSGDIV